jgi:hypothetical protein
MKFVKKKCGKIEFNLRYTNFLHLLGSRPNKEKDILILILVDGGVSEDSFLEFLLSMIRSTEIESYHGIDIVFVIDKKNEECISFAKNSSLVKFCKIIPYDFCDLRFVIKNVSEESTGRVIICMDLSIEIPQSSVKNMWIINLVTILQQNKFVIMKDSDGDVHLILFNRSDKELFYDLDSIDELSKDPGCKIISM